MKNQKNILFIRAIAIMALGACGLIHSSSVFSETADQLANAKEHVKLEQLRKEGKCPDKNIIAIVDGHSFWVPRSTSVIQGNKRIGDLEYNCSSKVIEGVTDLRMVMPEGEEFRILKLAEGFITFERRRKEIELAEKEKRIKILTNGTKEINLSGVDIFILPESQISSKNGEPVAFDCASNTEAYSDFQFCNTFYQHSNGLYISYSFARKNNNPQSFLRKAIERNIIFENLLVEDSEKQNTIQGH